MAGIQIPNFVVVLVAILLIVLVYTAMQEAQFTLMPSTEAAFSDYLQAQIASEFSYVFSRSGDIESEIMLGTTMQNEFSCSIGI
jgi:hypothetical protein